MSSPSFLAQARQYLAVGTSLFALLLNLGAPVPVAAQASTTATPIQHVIVIIGENRSFDHVYATYKPKAGQTVSNLLSKGIITANGQPGPNSKLAAQFNALDNTTFSISPKPKHQYENIPAPGTQGAPTEASDAFPAPFQTLAVAELAEPDLFGKYNNYLITGATGLPFGVADTRIPHVFGLGSGPFQLTSSSLVYDSYTGSPVHRFYQMWQQTDCAAGHANSLNPSGCLSDLFSWVEVMNGTGGDGAPRPKPFTNLTTGEGSDALGFYNVQKGDAPYMKFLADNYTLSDNMHQSVMGGTGANHIMFGYADAMWFSNGKGDIATPPKEEIENPNPQAGTNNWYDQDGYSGGSYQLFRYERARRSGDRQLPAVPEHSRQSTLRTGRLLSAEQLQPGLHRQWEPAETDIYVHNSAYVAAAHRRRALRSRRFLHLLRRRLEPLRSRSRWNQSLRRLLQHLQPVSIRQRHHD